MTRTFVTIAVLCWLAIRAAIDPRLIVACLMWLALGVFTAAIALAVLGVAALLGAGP